MKKAGHTTTPTHIAASQIAAVHIIGIIALLSAVFLSYFEIRFSIIPLVCFLSTCLIAPFFPGMSYFLPIITQGESKQKAVALTFDDGPDPISTSKLLTLLSKYNAKATFFVTGNKAAMYPELIREIIQTGHTIGNHTFNHDTLIMLKSTKTLWNEIQSAQDVLKKYGIQPIAFRPPAGITNPKLGSVLAKLGMYCVNFRCRAFDAGNRQIRNLSEKILHKVRPGDIILLHDVIPAKTKDTHLSDWLMEIERILIGIKTKDFVVLPLSKLIHMPVMGFVENISMD